MDAPALHRAWSSQQRMQMSWRRRKLSSRLAVMLSRWLLYLSVDIILDELGNQQSQIGCYAFTITSIFLSLMHFLMMTMFMMQSSWRWMEVSICIIWVLHLWRRTHFAGYARGHLYLFIFYLILQGMHGGHPFYRKKPNTPAPASTTRF